MASWCRVSQSKLKYLYCQFKTVPYGSLLNSSAVSSINKPCSSSHNPYFFILNKPTDFFSCSRFFAAPVQFQVKQKEEKNPSGPLLNEQIKTEFVRLVLENGHEIVPRRVALDRARKLNLDLVEVQGKADPPVCKIMDFHKEQYQKKLREKDRAKSKSEGTLRAATAKEIRFSVKTEQKDIQLKADMAKRLMEQGYRVKCTARGTQDQALESLTRLAALIDDLAVVESGPHIAKDGAYVIVRHVKFGQSKKGGGKKYQAVGDSSPKVEKVTSNMKQDVDSGGPIEGLETEDIPFGEVDQAVSSNPTIKPMVNLQQGASIRSDSDGLVQHPKQAFDSTKTHSNASQSEFPNMTENRYKKNDTENRFSKSRGMDVKGMGMKDPVRFQPRFSNHSRQPPRDTNFSPPTRENRQAETKASIYGNSEFPLNNTTAQESSGPGAQSNPRTGYGFFSPHNANTPGKQGIAGEANRNREENRYDARNPSIRGFTANQNQPSPKSDRSQPEIDKGGQRGWGIFSKESSNMGRNSLSKES